MNKDDLQKVLDEHKNWIISDHENGSRADLRGADLSGADLSGAYLSGAKSILSIGPLGSREDILFAVIHKDCVMVKAGCFWGSLKDFSSAVKEKHAKDIHGKNYQAAIKMIKEWSKTQ